MTPPASGTLFIFMINASSPLLDETRRKRFHSKVSRLLSLGRRFRMNILTAVAFLKEEGDGRLLRVLKYYRGTQEIGLVLDGRHGVALYTLYKGHSGAVASVGNPSVYASSIKRKVMSRSFFEAELNG